MRMSGIMEQPISAAMRKDYVSAKKDQILGDVVCLMANKGVSFVPVLDDFGVVIGTISERDLAKVFNNPTVGSIIKFSDELLKECLNKPVSEIMNAQPITLEDSAPVSDAIRIFANNHVHVVPVVNKAGVIVGILRLIDILSHETK